MTIARTWQVAEIKKAFEQYCTPLVYEITVHYQFWQLDLPGPLVSIDVHAFTLLNKAKHCNFGEQKTKVIGDKIMFCYPDKRTMEAMIRTLKLDIAIKICHAAEVAHDSMRELGVISLTTIDAISSSKFGDSQVNTAAKSKR